MILFVRLIQVLFFLSFYLSHAQTEGKLVCRINQENYDPYHGYHSETVSINDTIVFEVNGVTGRKYVIDTIYLWINLDESPPLDKNKDQSNATGAVSRGTELREDMVYSFPASDLEQNPSIRIPLKQYLSFQLKDFLQQLSESERQKYMWAEEGAPKPRILYTDKIRFQVTRVYEYEDGRRKIIPTNLYEFKFITSK